MMKICSDFEHVNIGSGKDLSILELAKVICKVVGFKGEVVHDITKPDATLRKLMSTEKIGALGWKPTIHLTDDIAATYTAFSAEGGISFE